MLDGDGTAATALTGRSTSLTRLSLCYVYCPDRGLVHYDAADASPTGSNWNNRKAGHRAYKGLATSGPVVPFNLILWLFWSRVTSFGSLSCRSVNLQTLALVGQSLQRPMTTSLRRIMTKNLLLGSRRRRHRQLWVPKTGRIASSRPEKSGF